MEIILIKEVTTLGNPGDILTVKNGYARNYLLPQKLAVRKTPTSLKILEKQRSEFDTIITKRKLDHDQLHEKLQTVEALTIPSKASKEGKLYAAVTIPIIQEHLKTLYGIDLDKQKFILRKPIKTLGEHEVTISIAKTRKAVIKVLTEASED